MKPTQEQIKEFWEGYGVDGEEETYTRGKQAGEFTGRIIYPPIDLNNLFKYAVPKALIMLAKKGYVPPLMKLLQMWYDELVTLTGDSSNVQDAADALFWTLDKIRKEQNK